MRQHEYLKEVSVGWNRLPRSAHWEILIQPLLFCMYHCILNTQFVLLHKLDFDGKQLM